MLGPRAVLEEEEEGGALRMANSDDSGTEGARLSIC